MEECCAEHTFIDCGIREVNLDGCQYLVDLSPVGLLGKGFQGEVRAAREVSSGLVVAAKLMKLDKRARTEARALKLCAHESVARLVGLWEADDLEYCVLLTELCDQGELFDTIIEYENGLPIEMTRDFFTKIASALSHMHAHRVAHRDLKPRLASL
ncbi:kinase-like domain-containing protein [Pavlovales sp. CCMP2436]|nr:kinase-like domain-containing protein [Pavlovales sp. CCMP2436]